MAFWNSEQLKNRVVAENLIVPFDEKAVKHCAYELAMGVQAAVTSDERVAGKDRKLVLGEHDALVIPPGQFALLLTKEKVTIPDNAIGFISIRASKKFDGLVNVSGFHVDPGYSNHLKFSVYNAGSRDIVISEGDRIFMIWFADLNEATADVYKDAKPEQNEISTQDLMRMQGEVASPAQLKKDIVDLEHSINNMKWILGVAVTLAGAIAVRLYTMGNPNGPPVPTPPQFIVVSQTGLSAPVATPESSETHSQQAAEKKIPATTTTATTVPATRSQSTTGTSASAPAIQP